MALAAGLTADRIRNVSRGRTTVLKGDALARVADVIGIEPGALTGTEPWPVGGLRPRPQTASKGKKGFAISADPMRDLVRAAEMAADAASVAAEAARQAAEAVKMAMSRRNPVNFDGDQLNAEATHRQPKVSRVDPLDRMAYRMRYQGMVRVFDEHSQVQLGRDALSMVGWSPLVSVTILGKAEYLVEDMQTGDVLGIYPAPSEAAEVAMVKASERDRVMNSRRRHPLACMRLRSMGAGGDVEWRLASSVDEAHETYTAHFFEKLVKNLKEIATMFDGALKSATEKATRRVGETFAEFKESQEMTPEQLHLLGSLCRETSQRVRRYCVMALSGHSRDLGPLRAVAYLELSGERLLRIAASGRVTPFQTFEEQRAVGYVCGEIPSLGMPD